MEIDVVANVACSQQFLIENSQATRRVHTPGALTALAIASTSGWSNALAPRYVSEHGWSVRSAQKQAEVQER